MYRIIRPQQKKDVQSFGLMLEGSIDEYTFQLLSWKSTACAAGLDYGEQPEDEEFSQFDAFIYRFLESIPLLKDRIDSELRKFAS